MPVTCAPRWDDTQLVVTVPIEWKPVAEKLAAVGRRRAKLPHPSPQRHDVQEEALRREIWAEIRRIWYDEGKKTSMPASVAMKLLGLSRQAFYNVLNHQVGDQVGELAAQPTARGAAYIRTWAKEHGLEVPHHGPIPRNVLDTYMEAMGEQSDAPVRRRAEVEIHDRVLPKPMWPRSTIESQRKAVAARDAADSSD